MCVVEAGVINIINEGSGVTSDIIDSVGVTNNISDSRGSANNDCAGLIKNKRWLEIKSFAAQKVQLINLIKKNITEAHYAEHA